MNAYIRGLRVALVGLTLLGMISGPASAGTQSVTEDETVHSVRRILERLPYYGVFDFIVFSVDRGTVTLAGYSFNGRLKADAEMAMKRARGVDEVADKIDVPHSYHREERAHHVVGVVDNATDRLHGRGMSSR